MKYMYNLIRRGRATVAHNWMCEHTSQCGGGGGGDRGDVRTNVRGGGGRDGRGVCTNIILLMLILPQQYIMGIAHYSMQFIMFSIVYL